jgi:hypothetical protein
VLYWRMKKNKAPTVSNEDLIAAWLKTNTAKKFELGQVTPKEEQVGYGFGRPRPKRKSTNID